MKKILTGSRAFFSGMEGYQPKDTDTIVIVSNPQGFEYVRQTSRGSSCTFEVADRPKADHIRHALEKAPAMTLVRFLTPDYAKHIGLTVADLDQLQPLADRLDPKHQYARIILDAYRENGDFTLTDAQRTEAYAAYKAARPQKKERRDR